MLRGERMLRTLRGLQAAALHSGLLHSANQPLIYAFPSHTPSLPSSSATWWNGGRLHVEQQAGLGQRSFAGRRASQHQPGVSLKASLRNLYRLIHPDFFHDFPAERQENERSFALLQEYLSAMEDRKGSNQMYDFVFYLRDSPHSGATTAPPSAHDKDDTEDALVEDAEEAEVLEGLYKVAVSLPPPNTSSRTGQLALGKLLRAVGLSPDVEFSRGVNGGSDIGRTLQDIIEESAEAVRRRQATTRGVSTQLSLARTALRMGRRVQFSVGSSAGIGTKEEERDLYIKFAAACDMLPDMQMEGLRVCLGAGYGIDVGGVLWLDASDDASQWAPWMAANEAAARTRAASAAQMQAQEASVAQTLGVGMIFTSRVLALSPEYMGFLRSAVVAAAMHGPIGGEHRPFSSVPICVLARASAPDGQELYGLSQRGLLTCPVDSPMKDIYSFVQRKGVQAAHILSAKAQEEQEMHDLVTKVRKTLRLRHLVKDKYLPPSQFKACCNQLLLHQRELGSVMDGLSICVSDSNGVSQEGDMVALKWNYTL